MRTPSTHELLALWDIGNGRDHTIRALLMLECAQIRPGGADIADLSVGTRDGLLLDLRESLFGPRIDALERCPACGSRLEFAFDIGDVRARPPETGDGRLSLTIDGYEITARLPTSRDLLAVRNSQGIAEARCGLLDRSLTVVVGGNEITASALPDAVLARVSAALGDADPQAEVALAIACADCAHPWRAHFDIVDYLWSEVEQFAQHALRDVHLLARAYGWSEDAILRLSPRRRRDYLEMIASG